MPERKYIALCEAEMKGFKKQVDPLLKKYQDEIAYVQYQQEDKARFVVWVDLK